MKFIKKNKFTLIVIVLFIMMVIAGVKIKDLLVPNSGKAIYGNRLDGKVVLSDEMFSNIKDVLIKDEMIDDLTYDIRGKLVNFTLQVSDVLSVYDAKWRADMILDHFSEEGKAYYDIQVFVVKKNEDLNDFPIIGYKHTKSDHFVYTKNRAVSE